MMFESHTSRQRDQIRIPGPPLGEKPSGRVMIQSGGEPSLRTQVALHSVCSKIPSLGNQVPNFKQTAPVR